MREHVPLLIQKKQNFDYFFKEKKKTLLTLVVNMAFNVLLNNTDVGIIIINNDFN